MKLSGRFDLDSRGFFFSYIVVVKASSRLKSGFALGLELGRKLYFAIFLGLYPIVVGGDLGGIGGLSMGGGRRMYGFVPHVCCKI